MAAAFSKFVVGYEQGGADWSDNSSHSSANSVESFRRLLKKRRERAEE